MKKLLPFIILGALAVLPLAGLNTYLMHIIILAVMWTVAGIAWNLLGGYCGQVSFGHAAFFGMGAYSAGLLTHHLGVSAWWGFLVSVPIVALVGLIMGLIVLRLRGPYFVLATLAIGEVMRITCENLTSLTNGTLGIMITRTWVEKPPTTTSSWPWRPCPSRPPGSSCPRAGATTSWPCARTRTRPSRWASTPPCTRPSP
jgi:branched-chain amino acid transport system permease protein